MHFLKEIYVGDKIRDYRKIQWKLKHGMGLVDIYVISLSQGKDQLDCMHCMYFKQKAVRDNVGLVVGLAKGYAEAQALMISMVEEALHKTGSADVKTYLKTYKV